MTFDFSRRRPDGSDLEFEERLERYLRAPHNSPVRHNDDAVSGCREITVVRDHDYRTAVAMRELLEIVWTLALAALSRLPVGSSARISSGSLASARAIATR